MLKNFINEEIDSNESYETPFINLFPFDFQYNKQQDLEEAEYIKLYFIEKKDTKETSSIHENDSKALIFIITKEKDKEFGNEFLNRKKKTGREPKDPFNSKINKTQTRKFERDDILTKNQVHYFTYIIYVANALLEKFGIKEKFMQIDYSFKKKVNFDYFLELREKKLVDIISMEITSKIKKQMKDHNKNLCEKIFTKIINYYEKYKLFRVRRARAHIAAAAGLAAFLAEVAVHLEAAAFLIVFHQVYEGLEAAAAARHAFVVLRLGQA